MLEEQNIVIVMQTGLFLYHLRAPDMGNLKKNFFFLLTKGCRNFPPNPDPGKKKQANEYYNNFLVFTFLFII